MRLAAHRVGVASWVGASVAAARFLIYVDGTHATHAVRKVFPDLYVVSSSAEFINNIGVDATFQSYESWVIGMGPEGVGETPG
jgi:hypothetical protein